ncbi:ABC transporter substrate-binding protein [Saccharomonospora sp. NPDC046836]|uniref:ABC transporter substrate-binding protein n=1 Tax=Saccharomonospora sp. NPDC046836 TaxID=3156921 RepID=UPI0033E83339
MSGCRLAVDEARGESHGTAPRAGGTLTMAVNIDADPAAAQSQLTSSITWRRLVFETLTAYDENGIPQPQLATGWEFSEGGRVLTLRLRPDVLLHSGRAVDARDVIYSLGRTADPDARSQGRSIASVIADMTADDPHTVRIRLQRPASNLFDLFELASVIDHESANDLARGTSVIGTGPFTWESWTPGDSLHLTRNPHYRVPGRPYLDRIEQSTIIDPTALVTAIRGGRAHVGYGSAPLDAKGLSADGRFEIGLSAGAAYSLGLDVLAPPFTDIRVRQAIGYAIDRERIRTQVFAGYGEASSLWWTRNEPGWDETQSTTYRYDPELARSMIAAAGATGKRIVMDVRGLVSVRSMAEIVRYDLEAVGLGVQIQILDSATFDQRLATGKLNPLWATAFGIADLGAATLVSSIPPFLPSGNASHFRADAYQAIVHTALTAPPDKRKASVHALGAYLQEQAFDHSLVVAPLMTLRSRRVRDAAQTRLGALVLDNAYLV